MENYKYSPISEIVLMNFRNIKEAVLNFKDSPIMCLVGDNEAGKTSVVKGIGVAGLHSNPREQKNYIRTGTNFFGIAIRLDDGSLLRRQKSNAINSYSIDYSDGRKWEISKVSEGLPVEVSKLMGLIEEPETKEYLHIRSYEDLLLFAATSYSTNYKVMYNALKVENLTKAIKLASTDINKHKSEISKAEDGIDIIDENKKNINVVDTAQLISIKNRLSSQLSTLDKLDKAVEILNMIEQKENKLGLIKLLDMYDVKEVNIPLTMTLNNLYRSLDNIEQYNNRLEQYKDVDKLQDVDLNMLSKIYRLEQIQEKLKNLSGSGSVIADIEKLETVDELQIVKINSLYRNLENIEKINNELSKINVSNLELVEQKDLDSITKLEKAIGIIESNTDLDRKQKECEEYVGKMTEYLKQCGVAFEICQNCGSDVIIDLDKLKD